jgi:hypothetical protein
VPTVSSTLSGEVMGSHSRRRRVEGVREFRGVRSDPRRGGAVVKQNDKQRAGREIELTLPVHPLSRCPEPLALVPAGSHDQIAANIRSVRTPLNANLTRTETMIIITDQDLTVMRLGGLNLSATGQAELLVGH